MPKKSNVYKLTVEWPSYWKDYGYFSSYKKGYEAYQKLMLERPWDFWGSIAKITEIELDKI